MTQSAMNDWLELPPRQWTLVSEVNFTFVVITGVVEILGTAGTVPAAGQRGVPYRVGEGEDAATDMLARFAGAGAATELYAWPRHPRGIIFVSRAAVA